MPGLMQGLLSRIIGSQGNPVGINPNAKDPMTKRPTVAPTMGGGFLEQYGIFTPAQKAQMQDQQQQQQQDAMSLLQAQLSPSQRNFMLAHRGAAGLGQKLQGFMQNKGMMGGNPQQAQGTSQGTQAGEGGSQFAQMVSQNGGDVPKAMTEYAKQLLMSQDPNLQNAGIKMLQDAQKMQTDQGKDQATISKDTTQATQNQASADKISQEMSGNTPIKNGEIQTVWNGRNAIQQRYDAAKKDWVNVGKGDRALKQEIVQGTPGEWDLTKTQQGEQQIKWQDLQIAAKDMSGGIDKLITSLKTTPSAAGMGGEVILKTKNLFDTAANVMTSLGLPTFKDTSDKALFDKADWSSFDKVGGARAFNKAQVSDVAYMYAKIKYDQKGQGLSNKDVERVIDRMGAAYSDPKLGTMLLEDMKDEINRYLKNYADVKGFKPAASGKTDYSTMTDDEIKAALNGG